jgi:hypothetical protein
MHIENLHLWNEEDFHSAYTAHTNHALIFLMVNGCLGVHTQSIMINHSICCTFRGYAMMTVVTIHTITEQKAVDSDTS